MADRGVGSGGNHSLSALGLDAHDRGEERVFTKSAADHPERQDDHGRAHALQPDRHDRPAEADSIQSHQDEPGAPGNRHKQDKEFVPEGLAFLHWRFEALGQKRGIAPRQTKREPESSGDKQNEIGPRSRPADGPRSAKEKGREKEDLRHKNNADLDDHRLRRVPHTFASLANVWARAARRWRLTVHSMRKARSSQSAR